VTGNLLELESRGWRRPIPTLLICLVTPSYLSNRAFRCQTNNMIHANAWGDLPQKPLPERGASSEHLHDLNYYDDTTQYICARFPSSLQLEAASKDSPYLEEKIRVVPSAEGGSEGQLVSYGKNLAKLL